MPAFTDQLGRSIMLDRPPSRIISFVPSQTELLYDLGANVIGITKFCVHPTSWFRELPRIGGTKDIRPEKIAALQPDLIIANKEENNRDQIEALATQYPVWISDIRNLTDALAMIRSVGELVAQPQKAQSLAANIEKGFNELRPLTHPLHTAYLIWRTESPRASITWMTVGGDTFIHDMLQRCGFTNLFAAQSRYPTVDIAALTDCDLVLLSSEPYPFRDRHLQEIQTRLPNAIIRFVDGQLFSWYGSRLLQAPAYFQNLQAGCRPEIGKNNEL
jgi:ABC-type Fe3+-hydroxamate transport system substrate-binding protein